jgi:hypothetical protein
MPSHATAAPDSAEAGDGNSRKRKGLAGRQRLEGETTTQRKPNIRDITHSFMSNHLPVSEIGHRREKERGRAY